MVNKFIVTLKNTIGNKPLAIKRLILGTATIGLLIGVSAEKSYATDEDVEANITTRAAITLTKNNDMEFGIVDYSAVHSGDIILGTNDAIDVSGTVGITSSGGTPAAADVDVAGDGSTVVDIFCETGGTLFNGAASLTLSATEIAIDTGVAPGLGTACAGLGVAATTHNLGGAQPTPKILMGGTINVDGNSITASGLYSTTIGAGTPAVLRVTYQ